MAARPETCCSTFASPSTRTSSASGLDLYLDLPITVGEAYRGAKVRVPTPDGAITLTVPKHAQSGQIARLKGRGVKRKTRNWRPVHPLSDQAAGGRLGGARSRRQHARVRHDG